MRPRILLPFLAAMALGSCSVYRSGQTPDDVYYSPARPAAAASYADADNRRDGQYYGTSNDRYNSPYNDNSYYDPYATDYWLRMRAHNPYRWSTFDDYSYYGNDWRFNTPGYSLYNPYYGFGNTAYYGLGAGFGLGLGGYWNNYYGWNSFYNPYYTNVIVASPKEGNYFYNQLRNNVRPINVRSYSNRMYNNTNGNFRVNNHGSYAPAPRYNNSNSGSNYRQAFPSDNNRYNNSNNSYERPSRTYTPSTTPSYSPAPSSSGGGSSGGSGVTRPGRG